MRRTVTVAVAGLTVGGTAQFATALPASADLSTCDAGEFCLWENQDYNAGSTNHVHQWQGNAYAYSQYVWYNAGTGQWSGDGLNDEASSAKNNGRSCATRIYQHRDFQGPSTTFSRGDSDPWLANNVVGDNQASSHEWIFCDS